MLFGHFDSLRKLSLENSSFPNFPWSAIDKGLETNNEALKKIDLGTRTYMNVYNPILWYILVDIMSMTQMND